MSLQLRLIFPIPRITPSGLFSFKMNSRIMNTSDILVGLPRRRIGQSQGLHLHKTTPTRKFPWSASNSRSLGHSLVSVAVSRPPTCRCVPQYHDQRLEHAVKVVYRSKKTKEVNFSLCLTKYHVIKTYPMLN